MKYIYYLFINKKIIIYVSQVATSSSSQLNIENPRNKNYKKWEFCDICVRSRVSRKKNINTCYVTLS